MKRLALALMAWLTLSLPAYAGSASFSNSTMHFGDQTNARPAPTSGTLTGTYLTQNDWVQTGPITCNGCHLHFGGNFTFNASLTTTPGYSSALYGISTLDGKSGAGGAGTPGLGGNGIYIEAAGIGTLTSSASIVVNGQAGVGINSAFQPGAGGGYGAAIDIRTLGGISVAAGAQLQAEGGAGGVNVGGGGYGPQGNGGYINLETLGTFTNNGTTNVTGNVNGTVNNNAYFEGPRLAY